MPGHRKLWHGCWTCRLRRKKCDGSRPECNNCAGLEIACYHGAERPEWMDGAAKQTEMIERIKHQIKKGASARRETRSLQRMRNGEATFIVHMENDYERVQEPPSTAKTTPSEDRTLSSATVQDTSRATSSSSLSTKSPNQSQSLVSTHSPANPNTDSIRSILDLADLPHQDHAQLLVLTLGRAWEMDFVMMYLDYVFPFLFPFYHPPLVGTGRAWLLTFLRQSDAVFHSVISLSAYFFIVGIGDIFPGKPDHCKTIVWDQVLKQADLSFEMIQKDITEVNDREQPGGLLEKAHLMESIIQLLIFEGVLGRSTNWDIHLKPAMIIFEEIFKEHALSSSEKPEMLCVLEEMAWQPGSEYNFARRIWNPDQACFRFFTATLIFIDIVASTSLGQAPQLTAHHSLLLGDVRPEDVSVPIDLSAFFGCQNRVLIAVGEVAGLYAWKKDMKTAGCLSVPDLVQRASRISQALARAFDQLNESSSSMDDHPNSRFQSYYHTSDFPRTNMVQLVSRIWAHATEIYLSVVVSGWQPANAEIRQNIEQILFLLQDIRTASQMRALAWPICVAGCLAEEGEQEQEFRNVIARTGEQRTLNTLREVQEIMEAVWRIRDTLNRETWDLTASFRVLGAPALLV
ncbi:fungal-specific transcription factor domain-containing protein [Lipomyces kononenkoae]